MKALFALIIFILFTGNALSQINLEKLKKAKIFYPKGELNSVGHDYAPTLSSSGKLILFTSNRPGSIVQESKKPSHDFWAALNEVIYDDSIDIVEHIDNPDNIFDFLNSELNEGSGSLSPDGKSFYFTGCNRPNGLGSCDIYSAIFYIQGNKIVVNSVQNMGNLINSSYFDSNPAISPDNKTLFFTSTRGKSNNMKEMDLYYAEWNDKLQMWSKPVRMSDTVNSPFEDTSPFMCPDNKTLLFSSKRGGKKDMDFYYTVRDSLGNWSEPVNLGEPFNTTYDERFITMNGTGEIILISSDREDIKGKKDGLDILTALSEPLFDEITLISYQQFEETAASINIYNDKDSLVKIIDFPTQKPGRYSFYWDCLDFENKRVPPGKYFFEVVLASTGPEALRPLIVN